ncbi:unnamed protein product, partial [Anisakis simplex]|uniref:Lysosomal acid phosphatase n=1 Tax=Anisakis simplex TaxID=6269 RepID=A0A0M3J0J7_ANISI
MIQIAIAFDKPKLIYVHIVWRHGDRAPVINYPNNIHKVKYWPNGYGELTERGLSQQYALGRKLRGYYFNNSNDNQSEPFISRHHLYKQVYIRSTDKNRTLLSAMATVAGMFSTDDVSDRKFDKNDKDSDYSQMAWPHGWIPVPVHTIMTESRFVDNPFYQCERAAKLEADAYKSDDYQNMKREHKEFLEDIANKSGSPTTIENGFIREYDCYFCEHDITINALMIALNCELNVLGKLSEIGYGANVAFELYLINNLPYVK